MIATGGRVVQGVGEGEATRPQPMMTKCTFVLSARLSTFDVRHLDGTTRGEHGPARRPGHVAPPRLGRVRRTADEATHMADTAPHAPGDTVGLRIEVEVGPPANGGFCVARHEGRAVFVRHALPGERVIAEVTDGAGTDSFWRADAVEILQASPDRVEGAVPVRGPGPVRRLRLAARHAGGAAPAQGGRHRGAAAAPGEAGPHGRGRGGRVRRSAGGGRVQFAADRDGKLGFRRHRSHDVIPVEECAIAAGRRRRGRGSGASVARCGDGWRSSPRPARPTARSWSPRSAASGCRSSTPTSRCRCCAA